MQREKEVPLSRVFGNSLHGAFYNDKTHRAQNCGTYGVNWGGGRGLRTDIHGIQM